MAKVEFQFSFGSERTRVRRIDGCAESCGRRHRHRNTELRQDSIVHKLHLIRKSIVEEGNIQLGAAIPCKLLKTKIKAAGALRPNGCDMKLRDKLRSVWKLG